MIPEPFTYIAAGFGIAMTLTSLVASTLESAKQRLDKFREYDDRIRQIGADIQTSDAELESCLTDWRDDRKRLQSLEDCARVFGDSRRRDLEEKIFQVISSLAKVQHFLLLRFDSTKTTNFSDVISGNLELPAGPVVEEGWDWIKHAERKHVIHNRKPWRLALTRKSTQYKLFLRAKFTVWDGETIKSRTERLQKSVGDFKKFTDLLSRSLPPADSLHSTLADRVTHFVQLDKEWSNLSSVMSGLSGSPFTVLPRLPDDEGQIDCLRKGADVTTSMMVETSDDETQTARKKVVYVSYLSTMSVPQRDRRARAIRGGCKSSASSLRVSCPRTEGRILRDLYGAVAERPTKERLRLQRLWELERAEFAISLITWTLLLWRTPWAKCICTARLQRHPSGPGRAQISMLPCAAENSMDGCSFEAQHTGETTNELNGPSTRGHYFRPTPTNKQDLASKRTLISLAVTLCEMALLTPIEISDIRYMPLSFNFGNQVDLTEEELLARVQKVTSRSYRRAVQRCFDYASAPICDVTTGADIIVFAEKVLVPFADWKSCVIDKRNNKATSPAWYVELPPHILEAMEI